MDPVLPHLREQEDVAYQSGRIHRVPEHMRQISPKDFEPREFFVGLYLHRSLISDNPMHSDQTKFEIAREFCRVQLPAAANQQGSNQQTSPPRPIRRETWTEFVRSFDDECMTNVRNKYDNLEYEDEDSMRRTNSVVILDSLFILAALQYEYDFSDCWGYDFQSVFGSSRYTAQRFPMLRDLLLLENQVPMLLLLRVMKKIHESRRGQNGRSEQDVSSGAEKNLNELLVCFASFVHPFYYENNVFMSPEDLEHDIESSQRHSKLTNCEHLLDCTYLAICGSSEQSWNRQVGTGNRLVGNSCGKFLSCCRSANEEGWPPRSKFMIRSATDLRRLGLVVKVMEGSVTLMNISLERKMVRDVLLVPKLIMNDDTASIFRNLALYEQIQDNGFNTRSEMRTYLYLMSGLLESVHDVWLLINQGVIVNHLGSAEAVCNQWNQMCDGLFLPPNPPRYWNDLQNGISKLERSKLKSFFVELKDRGFSSNVIFLSFLAVTVIFIATIVQTVYSVLSYYK
ncbi:hypothetical protein R1flu_001198 [Riccia fluitans]|uniref:Uncharacterized protein n=1 Tax=Riccia fluitans TaxID=41844 RepID=A0ABD1Y2M1_9MARC